MAGAKGHVYCFPSDTERVRTPCECVWGSLPCSPKCLALQVLKVTIGVPEDEQVSLIGPEFKGKNKWQNGFLGRDNAVYGLPCNAETVLRISEDDVSSRQRVHSPTFPLLFSAPRLVTLGLRVRHRR